MKKFIQQILSLSPVAAIALALVSCNTVAPKHQTSFTYDPTVAAIKNPSALQIKISTSAQRLYLVEGNNVVLATPCTVGAPSSPTPKGNFTILSKQEHRRRATEPGAGYPMTYWMSFSGPAYGIHWGFVKPVPATHGCVRVPLKAVKKIFHLVKVGTPVQVASSQPWDETIGKSLPVLNDGPLPNPPMSYLLSPQVFLDAKLGKHWNF